MSELNLLANLMGASAKETQDEGGGGGGQIFSLNLFPDEDDGKLGSLAPPPVHPPPPLPLPQT